MKIRNSSAVFSLIVAGLILWPVNAIQARPFSEEAQKAALEGTELSEERSTSNEPYLSYPSGTPNGRYTLDSIETFEYTAFSNSDCWGYVAPDGQKYGIGMSPKESPLLI